MWHDSATPVPPTACGPPTLAVQADVHDAMLDLHVPAQVALEVKLARAVRALEGFAARVQVHVAQQVVHSVEGLPAHLEHTNPARQPRSPPSPAPQPSHLHSWARNPSCGGQHALCPFLCHPQRASTEPLLSGQRSCGSAPSSLSWRGQISRHIKPQGLSESRLHRDLHPIPDSQEETSAACRIWTPHPLPTPNARTQAVSPSQGSFAHTGSQRLLSRWVQATREEVPPRGPEAWYLALEWLHGRVYNHVGLEGLLLHEGLEADVALVGPNAGVDQHVPLHVGLQGELPATHLALELLHALWGRE